MREILISIRPKWVEKIASGAKTVEVRKTAPKEVPFKCYIYCTRITEKKHCSDEFDIGIWKGNEHVIGEFVCDKVDKFDVPYPAWDRAYLKDIFEKSCLSYNDLHSYIGSGNSGYGWHICDLKIYDEPKELSEFKKAGFMTEEDWLFALYPNTHCHYAAWAKKFEITRPPESWCYVEKLANE